MPRTPLTLRQTKRRVGTRQSGSGRGKHRVQIHNQINRHRVLNYIVFELKIKTYVWQIRIHNSIDRKTDDVDFFIPSRILPVH